MRRKTEYLIFRWLRPYHLILLIGTTAFLALVSGYTISVATGKVDALFPYISVIGTTVPATNIFGIMLNLCAGFVLVTMYVRHSYNEFLIETIRYQQINDVAMFVGILSVLGIIMVACFPVTAVPTPHNVGAFLVYVMGMIYCWLQTTISYAVVKSLRNKIFIARILLSIGTSLAFVFTLTFQHFAMIEAQNNVKNTFLWKQDEPGYSLHLGSTLSQWIMTLLFLFYIFTNYWEFKSIKMSIGFRTGHERVEEDDIYQETALNL